MTEGVTACIMPRLQGFLRIFADDRDSHGSFSMVVLQFIKGGISWNVLEDTFFCQLVDRWLSYY